MFREEELLFVTTTLNTKWLDKQQSIIKNMFPNALSLIVDGKNNWPNVWFSWIKELKKYTGIKWVIHIDEDCFIINRDEFVKVIDNMTNNNIDVCGVPDGNHPYRGANPVAINTFLMIVNYDKLLSIESSLKLDTLQFGYHHTNGWLNSHNIYFDKNYISKFSYKFEPFGNGANFNFEQEPYYYLMWCMLNNGFKFDYLYPHFDDTYKSTNPRIAENTPDIAIHMWYVREWKSNMDVHGVRNCERYSLLEKKL